MTRMHKYLSLVRTYIAKNPSQCTYKRIIITNSFWFLVVFYAMVIYSVFNNNGKKADVSMY